MDLTGKQIAIYISSFLGLLLIVYTALQQFGVEAALKLKIGYIFPVIAIAITLFVFYYMFQKTFIATKLNVLKILIGLTVAVFLMFFASQVFPETWFSVFAP